MIYQPPSNIFLTNFSTLLNLPIKKMKLRKMIVKLRKTLHKKKKMCKKYSKTSRQKVTQLTHCPT